MVLRVHFPVAAGSSHTKDVKNGSGPCLHGTHDEEGTTKHNWSARCQYNVTGWVSMCPLCPFLIQIMGIWVSMVTKKEIWYQIHW